MTSEVEAAALQAAAQVATAVGETLGQQAQSGMAVERVNMVVNAFARALDVAIERFGEVDEEE
jgi:hypothetical protein